MNKIYMLTRKVYFYEHDRIVREHNTILGAYSSTKILNKELGRWIAYELKTRKISTVDYDCYDPFGGYRDMEVDRVIVEKRGCVHLQFFCKNKLVQEHVFYFIESKLDSAATLTGVLLKERY